MKNTIVYVLNPVCIITGLICFCCTLFVFMKQFSYSQATEFNEVLIVSVIVLLTSLISVVTGGLGMYAACAKQKVMLKVCGIIFLILCMIELLVFTMSTTFLLAPKNKSYYTFEITKIFTNIDRESEANSIRIWNKCCQLYPLIVNAHDFLEDYENNQNLFSVVKNLSGNGKMKHFIFPAACCGYDDFLKQCTIHHAYKEDCVNAVLHSVKSDLIRLACISFSLGIIQLVCSVFTFRAYTSIPDPIVDRE